MKKLKKLFKIFTTSMFVSSFTFGGGYVIIPLMRKKFVDDLKWLEENEMLDMTSIAQSAPGSIAVNASLQLGFKVAGVLGAISALLGTVLPSLVIVILVSIFYNFVQDNVIVRAVLKGMQAGVAALICDISLNLCGGVVKQKKILNIIVMLAAFALVFFVKINVAYIILACIFIGIALSVIQSRNKANMDIKNTAEDDSARQKNQAEIDENDLP